MIHETWRLIYSAIDSELGRDVSEFAREISFEDCVNEASASQWAYSSKSLFFGIYTLRGEKESGD